MSKTIHRTFAPLLAVVALGLATVPISNQVHAGAGGKAHKHGQGHGGHKASFGEPGRAAGVTRTVKVIATDMKFDIAALKVKEGETIRFVITNKGEAEHDFTLGDAATQRAHRKEMAKMMEDGKMMHHVDPNAVFLKAGETKELIWKFNRGGHLEFACNVPGHYEAGMKGRISVVASGKAPAKSTKPHTHRKNDGHRH